MLSWFGPEKFPLYLAPMAGFTDMVFRGLCKERGADVMITEFVMADGLLRERERVWRTIDFVEEQRPMGVQIFGSSPQTMAEAGKQVMDRLQPDFLDLNFGCPADKVTCQDAGSSLLRDLPKLGRVAKAVVDALPGQPVTAKMRIGWDESSIVAVEAARILEEAGIRAIAVHGRTKVQGYSGEPNWPVIAEVAETVKIPVIGNGNITDAREVTRIRRETKCAGLMIGRAALGYPWIFDEIKAALRDGATPPPPTLEERWAILFDYATRLQEQLCPYPPERKDDIGWMRAKILSLTKNLPGGKKMRGALSRIKSLKELEALRDETLQMASLRNERPQPLSQSP
ncbi:MAG: tRNA dihydrouridine synthase DusB [Opitutales bacterium]|nr:tRNA dihydrouridine synthase DusB [Opitutales bacterium]MCH8539607.1 tRNA dihydrouridine synthase DusB [Opitutales bacterium]